jgi:amiloride-sensitive sodium channel
MSINKVQVYFKENQFDVKKRSERFGFIDFISDCGGLMGLFMGISLLSIVEILHYFVYFLFELFSNLFRRDNRVFDFMH